jgi:hypothetical protein
MRDWDAAKLLDGKYGFAGWDMSYTSLGSDLVKLCITIKEFGVNREVVSHTDDLDTAMDRVLSMLELCGGVEQIGVASSQSISDSTNREKEVQAEEKPDRAPESAPVEDDILAAADEIFSQAAQASTKPQPNNRPPSVADEVKSYLSSGAAAKKGGGSSYECLYCHKLVPIPVARELEAAGKPMLHPKCTASYAAQEGG